MDVFQNSFEDVSRNSGLSQVFVQTIVINTSVKQKKIELICLETNGLYISLLFLGDHAAGGGGLGSMVMTHKTYAEKLGERIEELFLHETAHACLDYFMKV